MRRSWKRPSREEPCRRFCRIGVRQGSTNAIARIRRRSACGICAPRVEHRNGSRAGACGKVPVRNRRSANDVQEPMHGTSGQDLRRLHGDRGAKRAKAARQLPVRQWLRGLRSESGRMRGAERETLLGLSCGCSAGEGPIEQASQLPLTQRRGHSRLQFGRVRGAEWKTLHGLHRRAGAGEAADKRYGDLPAAQRRGESRFKRRCVRGARRQTLLGLCGWRRAGDAADAQATQLPSFQWRGQVVPDGCRLPRTQWQANSGCPASASAVNSDGGRDREWIAWLM